MSDIKRGDIYYVESNYSVGSEQRAGRPADEYIALLDYYSKEELDVIRAEHGDQFISMLFESEFGEDYESLYEEGVM